MYQKKIITILDGKTIKIIKGVRLQQKCIPKLKENLQYFLSQNQNAPYMCTKFECKILDKVTPCIKFKTDFGQIRSTFHTQTKHSI